MDEDDGFYGRLQYGYSMADAFTVPAFSELSTTSRFVGDQPTDTFDEAVTLPPLPKLDQGTAFEEDKQQPDVALHLPDLPELADLKLEPLDQNEHDIERADVLQFDSPQLPTLEPPAEEDVWKLTQKLPRLSVEPRLLSWDAFVRPELSRKPGPTFISEAGPGAFDACLEKRSRESPRKHPAGRPIQGRALLRSLWQLGLGRDSILFPFKKERNRFIQAIDDARWSGCTLECSQDLIENFLETGNMVRELKSFVDVAFAANGILPAVVALAHAVDVILETIETFATDAYADIRSPLQLQDLFEPVQKLVRALAHLAKEAEHCAAGSDFLDTVFAFVQQNEFGSSAYRRVLERILARTSADWLSTIADKVGFRQAILRSGLQTAESEDDSETWSGPTFIHEEDRQLINDTRTCLSYVQTQHPQHPVLEAPNAKNGSVELSLGFDWDEMEKLQKKASDYQTAVISAIRDYGLEDTSACEVNESTEMPAVSDFTFEAFQNNLMDGVQQADRPPSRQLHMSSDFADGDQLPDELREAVVQFLSASSSTFEHMSLQPPFSLTPSLSLRSLLRTQNHLLSYITAHSLLHEQGLRSHLELHHAFSLFASGLFSARLQHVLFSSETETAERRNGQLRIGSSSRSCGGMGLKLGTGERHTWPPASSEVRLALMGLLGDCWREEQDHNPSDASKTPPGHGKTAPKISKATTGPNALDFTGDDSLPGNLSFSIRTNLPDEAVERILNADSIAALDFLRLTYEPPAALAPLFSTRTLDLYDRAFSQWLRLTRMTAALTSLFDLSRRRDPPVPPETHLLRHEAHVFLTSVTAHLRLAAVEAPWASFTAALAATAHRCADPCPPPLDPAFPHAPPASLAALRDLHDAALARIAAGMLLRRRQGRAAAALEGACEDVLEFARALREGASEPGSREAPTGEAAATMRPVRALRASFQAHVAEFKGACGALAAAQEGAGLADEARALRELLSVLDGFRT